MVFTKCADMIQLDVCILYNDDIVWSLVGGFNQSASSCRQKQQHDINKIL